MVMTKLKSNGQIWSEVPNRYIHFSFCGNRIILSQNTGKFHIWLRKFKIRVIAKTKPIGHMWGRGFNQYGCFSFRDNRTTVGWDIANSIFCLEDSKSWSGRKSTNIYSGPSVLTKMKGIQKVFPKLSREQKTAFGGGGGDDGGVRTGKKTQSHLGYTRVT